MATENIAWINAERVETGDWALISLKPFDTVELAVSVDGYEVGTPCTVVDADGILVETEDGEQIFVEENEIKLI